MSSPLLADGLQSVPRFCCYQFDPLLDPRWGKLVEKHPRASVFHTVAWLRSLRSTYGYEPVAFTTSPPTGELKNGLVFCRVDSWLTGRRLVSLPFSDHCEPLYDSCDDLNFLLRYLQSARDHENWRYLEVRPISWTFETANETRGFLPAVNHFLHVLDLAPDIDEVFRSLDKDSVQRRVRRADRAGLVEKTGRSEDLLKDFYDLFVMTRGRHRLPPTPYAWCRNLAKYQDKALTVRLAYKDRSPIAGIVTLRFKDTLYYKYGGSNASFHNLGAMSWLLWQAIVEAKSSGATKFDFGRTEEDNAGLLAFKSHWVPQPKRFVYWRFPVSSSLDSFDGWKLRVAKHLFSCMPSRMLTIAGRLIYRHIG